MLAQVGEINVLLRKYFGVGASTVLILIVSLALAGVAAGLLFPKVQATALLQFPEPQKNMERPGEPRLPEQRSLDPKANVIELAAFKRVAASYDSAAQLDAYLRTAGLSDRPGAARLLKQAERPDFWSRVAVPILPFSRRDQKEFGDIKDASATTILGLELTVEERAEPMARDMVDILASYYINAVVRERMRAWTLAGKVDAQSQEKGVRADILRAELDIAIYSRRVDDMKAVLARYPDAVRMDSRQIVSINQSDGGERYLSPLAQLVGAESAILQRREMIRRWERELKQKTLLAHFYGGAEVLLEREVAVSKLLAELRALASKTFSHAESAQEWSQEAALRVSGALDNFEVMRSQFGVRNGIRAGEVAGRSPLRLAYFGIAAALGILAILAFLRATLRAARREEGAAPEGSSQF